ncbi:MAG: LysR family transcriptional regulator [Oscillospiraceae bacterium]|nr:LysR family transcriptional regulator [Oscillospiraceae bacterium]
MNLNQVKAFLSLANTLSFTQTARDLYLSQQSVSSQINLLEQELECRLFDRDNRHLCLTKAGKYYFNFFFQEIQDGKKSYGSLIWTKNAPITCCGSVTPYGWTPLAGSIPGSVHSA